MSGEPPDEGARSPAGDALTELILRTFRLNGLFLGEAEKLARPSGLTPARWQVLGAVLRGPLTVSDVARSMGLTRQSVQRLADALVADGLAVYGTNPEHKRARLLHPTPVGWEAIRVIRPRQRTWATALTDGMTADELRAAVRVMDALIHRIESLPPDETSRDSTP